MTEIGSLVYIFTYVSPIICDEFQPLINARCILINVEYIYRIQKLDFNRFITVFVNTIMYFLIFYEVTASSNFLIVNNANPGLLLLRKTGFYYTKKSLQNK